ncbi:hypothetical protein IFM46972_11044 [Aspergillus udagawae]|uniref:Uncharacterized protein n=1 Tax=Aspergillus udagawae TaxID=91492 RepID=A0A8H3SEX3_9EURO|nr:hypothetical protein IFM46972_11044 [Aspergillus udagawae]
MLLWLWITLITSQTKNTTPIEHSPKKEDPIIFFRPGILLMDHHRSFLRPLGPDTPGVCNYGLRP